MRALAAGNAVDTEAILGHFGAAPLVSVRPSSEDADWGGPGAILNIGMNDARHAEYAARLGREAADVVYLAHDDACPLDNHLTGRSDAA